MKNRINFYINNILCGETREIHRIGSGRFDGVLNFTPHFGWHSVDENYSVYRFQLGLLDEYIIIFTVGGSGNIYIKDQKYIAEPDTICIIPPGLTHGYTTGSKWEFFWIHIKKGPSTDILDYIVKTRGFFYPTDQVDTLTEKIDTLLESDKTGIEAELFDSNIIAGLLHDMLQQVVGFDIEQETSEKIKIIVDYIDHHYPEKITIDDLSKLINKSPGHTIRIFKSYTGYTPIEYLKKIRIMKACQLLDSTDYPVKRVASETGYNSVSHFITDFKALNSFTPQEYREKITKPQKLEIRNKFFLQHQTM